MPGRSFDETNLFHRTMRSFAATKVGAALLRPTARHLDRLITKVTGGRSSFAGITTGIPAVMLTTTGAKSGEPRTVAVYGIPRPDGLGLIASNWGGVKHPAWYYNIAAHPDQVRVEVAGRKVAVSAEQLRGQAREEAWQRIKNDLP
jgi:deazaflavin-dependent oxidoreductase (nitroreductase family)